MPLVTAAVLVYAAGLLSGFDSVFLWPVVVVALVLGYGARVRRDRLALTAIAASGFVTASIIRAREADCLVRLLEARAWDVVLHAPAQPGAFVPAKHACGVTLRLSVANGAAPTGALVRARGAAVASRGAVLVTDADIVALRSPRLLARWRSSIGNGIDAAFGANAPMARALLIADMREISPTVRDRWAASGLIHMLSVSGLHVGLIAVAVSLLAQIGGLRPSRADALVISITVVYVLVIGAPLPAVRAGVMLAVSSLSRTLQRPTSGWAILAVAALIPMLAPRSITDLGFQFSMVGMVALVAAGSLATRWEWLAVGGWRGTLYRSLVTSTVATLLTTPLVVATFGRASLVAPISNLVGVPIMGVLQPMLFLAAALLPIPAAAHFVADACAPLLAAVDRVAAGGALLPGASIQVLTDDTSLLFAGGAGAAFVLACVTRYPGRALVAGAACITVLTWRPLIPVRGAMTELHMIDVGQGDAVALRTTGNRWVLFDAGREWKSGDAGQRDVVPYVVARGGSLFAFVLSHPHADHVGGAASTLRALKPRWYIDPGFAGGSSSYRSSLAEARRVSTAWKRARPGDSLVVDEATITFLAPDSTWAETLRDPNDASTVARIRVGGVSMLLTGDAEAGEEGWLLENQSALLAADVLKVGHHGSRTSSTARFLRAVSPRVALVSVGTGNMYAHPSPEVLRSLAASGAIALRTDMLGSIVVRTDGSRLEVEAGGERWLVRP